MALVATVPEGHTENNQGKKVVSVTENGGHTTRLEMWSEKENQFWCTWVNQPQVAEQHYLQGYIQKRIYCDTSDRVHRTTMTPTQAVHSSSHSKYYRGEILYIPTRTSLKQAKGSATHIRYMHIWLQNTWVKQQTLTLTPKALQKDIQPWTVTHLQGYHTHICS